MSKSKEARLEKYLEERYRDHVCDTRCLCLKLVCLALSGWPDRTILCPGGRIYFAELKRPDGRGFLSRRQMIVREALTRMGFEVLVTDSLEEAKEFHDNFLTRTA